MKIGNRATVQFLAATAILLVVAARVWAVPGQLDPTFGNGGVVLTTIGPPSQTDPEQAKSVAVQADGKFVVAGFANGTSFLTRYNADGSTDTSFGSGGVVLGGNFNIYYGSNVVLLQTDGKILLENNPNTTANDSGTLSRYNSDGSLDTGFGSGGVVSWTDFSASLAALQSDGKVLVSGKTNAGFMALLRFNSDGSADPSFDGDGKLVTSITLGKTGNGSVFSIEPIMVQSDGKIVAAGSVSDPTTDPIVVLRYNSDGSVDPSFDGDGAAIFTVGPGAPRATAVAPAPDGTIVVAGFQCCDTEESYVLRLNADGSSDTSFNGTGQVDIAAPSDATSMVVQPDGKIVATGAGVSASGLFRLNTNGLLDSSFGTNGTVFTSSIGNVACNSVTLQSDGKIVVAGGGGDNQVALLRYLEGICGDGRVETGIEQCDDGNNIDGDGCDVNCTATGCGNGIVTAGEQCDDGDTTAGDGCDATCLVETGWTCPTQESPCQPICGDGLPLGNEPCDDGNLIEGDGCDSNCTLPGCGNSIVDPGEECDDGNTLNTDGCKNNCTVNGCVQAPPNLVGWWRAEGTTTDIIGGHTATLQGGAAYGAGEVGQAFQLNGVDGFIDIASDPALNAGTADFSIDLWVNFANLDSEEVLVEKYIENFEETKSGWTLSEYGFGAVHFDLGNEAEAFNSSTSLPTGTWMHFAARRSSGTLAVFKNGTLIGSGFSPRNVDSTASLKFGHRGDPSDTPGSSDTRGMFLDGRIDEVHLFIGHALSNAEIQNIYEAGSTGLCVPVCGDGLITSPETCDDGNAVSGDGCDANCHVEACWTCGGQPSVCAASGDGAACNDGLFCNGTDTCVADVCQHTGDPCVGGSECNNVCDETHATCNLPLNAPCSSDADSCTDDVCDGAGACAHPNNTASCDDGNPCTVGDACSDDICTPGGGTLACDDHNPCTDDAACSPASGCVHTFNTNPCDDGAYCTINDVCQNGACTSAALDCVDGDDCTVDTCNEISQSCDHGPQLTCGDSRKCGSESCDDGNSTDGDGCQADCTLTTVTVSETVGAGGTVTTDNGSGATVAFPTQTAVTLPTGGSGGTVTITQTEAAGPPVSGFGVLGQQIVINAPSGTATDPLRLVFTTSASLLPPGLALDDLRISKDGVLVDHDCAPPADQAVPDDPCIAERKLLPNGDAQIRVLTSTASTWATVAPAHDSVVLSRKPLVITIPAKASSVTKTMKVTVVNADMLPSREVIGHTVQLTAAANCPAGVSVSTPDFDPSTLAPDNTVTLAGGKSKAATVRVSIDSTGIANLTTVNNKAPVRCRLIFTASATSAPGNVDPVPSNDVTTVDVDFIDKHDAQQVTLHESVVKGAAPVTVRVGKKTSTAAAKRSVNVVNADFLPIVEKPGHSITVIAFDGTCPPGTVGTIDYDKTQLGNQSSVVVKGGAVKGGSLPLSIAAAAFHSGNAKSPARCVATVSVAGGNGDVDASNNTTHLEINVVDAHDF